MPCRSCRNLLLNMTDSPMTSVDRVFLNDARIEEAGRQVASLIWDDLSWIERRKESVAIVDDTVLRRQISVEFSLRGTTRALVDRSDGESDSLYCAPVFVLPKAPANLMAFDLVDESGSSLRLVNRVDNARISGAALRSMASACLQSSSEHKPVSGRLAREIDLIAEGPPGESEQRATRLINGALAGCAGEAAALRGNGRFCWWLSTIAHSSIVIAVFRAARPTRKLIKLTFEEPIAAEMRLRQQMGWEPYRVWVDSPLVEARTYHFEAESPPGLRITEAWLNDDASDQPPRDAGFLRRVHLYRANAQTTGAATAVLHLQVSGSFSGGAVLAALLTTAALLACALAADVISRNATSAPALLLFLPGLIATYVARPDQHALTTRLLSNARRLLIVTAGIAYVAAAKVALSNASLTAGKPLSAMELNERTDTLRLWLFPLTAVSALLLVALLATHMRGRLALRRGPRDSDLGDSLFVAGSATDVLRSLRSEESAPDGYTNYADGEWGVIFERRAWHGRWIVAADVEPAHTTGGHPADRSVRRDEDDVCVVSVAATYQLGSTTLEPPWLRSPARRAARTFLTDLQTRWCEPDAARSPRAAERS